MVMREERRVEEVEKVGEKVEEGLGVEGLEM